MSALVDSNVILDIFTRDPEWFAWSASTIASAASQSGLIINPVIYAEVSVRFSRIEDLDAALPLDRFAREPIPYSAAFLVGKAFSIGDIGIATQFVNFRHAGYTVDAKRWPKLAGYVAGVHARPSFKRLIEAETAFFGTAA